MATGRRRIRGGAAAGPLPSPHPRDSRATLSGRLMNISVDPILLVLQLLPFVVLMAGLHVILYKPMLAYLQQRAEATTGSRKKASELQDRAALKLQQWEAAFARAQAEVADFRAQKRAEAQAVYQKKVAVARAEADARVGAALGELQQLSQEARLALPGLAAELSVDMASQALGRRVNA